MTLIDIPQTSIPTQPSIGASSATISSTQIDGAGEYMASIQTWSSNEPLTRITFRTANINASGNVVVTVETVDPTTGFPTGTLIAPGATVTVTLNTITHSSTFILATFASPVKVHLLPQGTPFAVVIRRGTLGNFMIVWSAVQRTPSIFPYIVYNTGTPTKAVAPSPFVFETQSGVVSIVGGYPGHISAVTITSETTPNEIGIKLTLPFGVRARGVWADDALNAQTKIILYNSENEILSSMTLEGEERYSSGGRGASFYTFNPGVVLPAGTYRIIYQPQTSDNIAAVVASLTTPTGKNNSWRGGDLTYTFRTNLGAWTDSTDRVLLMGLIVDQIDIPNSGIVNFTGEGLAG